MRTSVLTVFMITMLSAVFLFSNPMKTRAMPVYGYLLPTSSYSRIDPAVVQAWPAQLVCYAKNEIYARNGRKFQSPELQNWFNAQYWYTPVYEPDQFRPDMLNEFETANVDMLSKREAELGTYTLDTANYSYDAVYPYLSDGSGQYYVNPDNYIFYNSNSCYLTDADLAALTPQELCYARNEIYARRGYIFSSTELSDYFNAKNWYWGCADASSFSDSVFNTYEASNIGMLMNVEYAKMPGGYVLDQPGYSYQNIGAYAAGSSAAKNSGFLFADSAARYLTDAEVSGLSLQELCYARNEIYARRGYIFRSQELRDYFGSKSWYYPTVPADSFSASVFNPYETANIELLKRYEYAVNPNGYQLY